MKVRISGLLHDIGKFYQRTRSIVPTKDLYTRYKKANGTYAHVAYTSMFIDKYLNENLKGIGELIELSSSHHRDRTIITKADGIAAAHDRKKISADSVVKDYENEGNYYEKRLCSIFSEIKVASEQRNDPYLCRLNPLKNFEMVEDSKYSHKSIAASGEYEELFKLFINELKEHNISSITDLNEIHDYLYPLIKEYTTSIPANTYEEEFSSVSLFDHLKLTSAVATCLEKVDNGNLIIVDYDLSGIQNFIFRITEGESTKQDISKHLRSRSFYLSLISDAVAFKILKEFDLSYENILYSSGGRGSILLPDLSDIKERLEKINYLIDDYLFNKYNAEISISLMYHTISYDDFEKESISDLKKVDEDTHIISAKYSKFSNYLKAQSNFIIRNRFDNVCKLCEINEAKPNSLCKECKTLEKLNDDILIKNSFIIRFSDEEDPYSLLSMDLGGLGFVSFYDVNNFRYHIDSYYLSINTDLIGESKYYAKHNNNISFTDLAKKCRGDEKLAVIKMDVDNLGYIFAKGIQESTISKNLTLSRMMDYYFSKKIKDVLNTNEYKDKVYINYSGGDDLLIITSADISIDVVNEIMTNFKKYVGNNSGLHISCGIEIFKPQSPVRFAVLRADDNLDAAKSKPNKNSLCVLDCTVDNKDLLSVQEDILFFENKLNNKQISRSNLYKIYSQLIGSLNKDKNIERFYHSIPRLAYSIKRNVSDEETLLKLKSIFIKNDISYDELEKNKIILGYALMNTREENK